MRDTGEMLGREKRLGIEMNKIPENDYWRQGVSDFIAYLSPNSSQ
jgi:hypothetical protein